MSEFKKMIKEYGREAAKLAQYKKELKLKMSEETDPDRLADYELRIKTADAERYEILADMKAMMSYEAEMQKCRENV